MFTRLSALAVLVMILGGCTLLPPPSSPGRDPVVVSQYGAAPGSPMLWGSWQASPTHAIPQFALEYGARVFRTGQGYVGVEDAVYAEFGNAHFRSRLSVKADYYRFPGDVSGSETVTTEWFGAFETVSYDGSQSGVGAFAGGPETRDGMRTYVYDVALGPEQFQLGIRGHGTAAHTTTPVPAAGAPYAQSRQLSIALGLEASVIWGPQILLESRLTGPSLNLASTQTDLPASAGQTGSLSTEARIDHDTEAQVLAHDSLGAAHTLANYEDDGQASWEVLPTVLPGR